MFDISYTDPSWHSILTTALAKMDQPYLNELISENKFIPDSGQIFNAFKLPAPKANFVLFGESPYPRKESANGFSFWDQRVSSIWSDTGLSKEVNRATSLRNLVKLLLISGNFIKKSNPSQEAIKVVDKDILVKTLENLFNNMIKQGFLLLNATPVLREAKKNHDAKNWLPFVDAVLAELSLVQPKAKLILFGKIAEKINALPSSRLFDKLVCEHPYNHSFISNEEAKSFFAPLNLLIS